jgi:DNA repair photolyase
MTIKSTYDISDKILKGRGAQVNPQNRFESTNASTKIIDCQYEEGENIYKTKAIETEAKTIVNKVPSSDVPLEYSMNAYQGCEHGCVYCYARNTHSYWGYSSGLDFESKIIVKTNAPALLKKQLQSKKWKASPIMMSGNTDCYQPLESHYKITRQMLQILLDYKHPVGLISKNSLMLRDLDIINEMAKDNLISVAVSINTLDDTLRQNLEPRASSVKSRLKLIETLVKEGISVTALAAPIIPGLNDNEIMPLVKKLCDLGVSNIGHIVVRLNGDIPEIFEEWLLRCYPNKSQKVLSQIKSLHGGQLNDSRLGKRMKGEGNIAEIIHQQFALAKRKYLIPNQFKYNTQLYEKYKRPQLSLF